jgi:hypothetical protein
MTGLEDTMKRTIHIRRRRRLYRTVVLGFAAAALAPATALGAFVVDRPDGGIDRYLAAPATDVAPIVVATTGYQQLPTTLVRTKAATTGYGQVTNATASRTVSATTVSAPATDWSQIALWVSLGLTAMLGVLLVGFTTRRGSRVAHS